MGQKYISKKQFVEYIYLEKSADIYIYIEKYVSKIHLCQKIYLKNTVGLIYISQRISWPKICISKNSWSNIYISKNRWSLVAFEAPRVREDKTLGSRCISLFSPLIQLGTDHIHIHDPVLTVLNSVLIKSCTVVCIGGLGSCWALPLSKKQDTK